MQQAGSSSSFFKCSLGLLSNGGEVCLRVYVSMLLTMHFLCPIICMHAAATTYFIALHTSSIYKFHVSFVIIIRPVYSNWLVGLAGHTMAPLLHGRLCIRGVCIIPERREICAFQDHQRPDRHHHPVVYVHSLLTGKLANNYRATFH